MALNAHVTLVGETQGKIEGSVTQAGREGTLEVYGFTHELTAERDAASGLPTGKRQHKPLTITKPVDKASPLLQQALVTNENITEWAIRFYRPERTGKEEQYYTITLENATVVNMRTEQLNTQYPENGSHAVREHVSFTYEKITWTNENEGTSAQDFWSRPRV